MQNDQIPPEAILLLNQFGRARMVEAIKLIRGSTGLGLKEAKDLAEQFLENPEVLNRRGSGVRAPAFSYTGAGRISAEAIAALRKGQQFEAIRLMQEQSGLSLKDAKEAVEKYLSKDPKLAKLFQSLAPGWYPSAPEQPAEVLPGSPDPARCLWESIKAGAIGLVAGFVLWVPSCVVGAVFTGFNERSGEAFANGILWLAPIIGLVVGWVTSFNDQKKSLERQAADDRHERNLTFQRESTRVDQQVEHKIREQISVGTEISTITGSALDHFEAMPRHILRAEELIDQAEIEYKDGAFAPFWDRIEQTTKELGQFDNSARTIHSNSDRYTKLTKTYLDIPPRFPITLEAVNGVVVANTTTDRLKAVVRQAQRNYQFASIYEQRKTNQILVAGFQNLAQALDGMGQRISSSINSLAGEISTMSSVMEQSFDALGEKIEAGNQAIVESVGAVADNVAALHETTRQSAAESVSQARSLLAFHQQSDSETKKRLDDALEMIDDIRHRRRPIYTSPIKHIGKEPEP